MRVIAATNNAGKISEFAAILGGIGIEVIGQHDAGFDTHVDETGATFEQNALLKAKAIAKFAGTAVIADDSGLCVDALGGRPGVFSARYAGEDASADMFITKLLNELKGVPPALRSAQFVSVVALCLPDGRQFIGRGTVDGMITEKPAGNAGFGYDPVFWVSAFDKTFAQMSSVEKNSISHRARALAMLKDALLKNL